MTQNNVIPQEQNYAQDVQLDQICKAQQDRVRAEEHKNHDKLLNNEVMQFILQNTSLKRHIRYTYHVGERICMFLTGFNVALAVHFYVASSLNGLLVTILSAFTFHRLSVQCYRKRLKSRR